MLRRQLRACLRTLLLVCALAACSATMWAQGAKKVIAGESSPSEPSDKDAGTTSDRVRERQQWLRKGRTALGENAAELLHRAYQQKMKMRAVPLAGSAQMSANSSAATAVSTVSATSPS